MILKNKNSYKISRIESDSTIQQLENEKKLLQELLLQKSQQFQKPFKETKSMNIILHKKNIMEPSQLTLSLKSSEQNLVQRNKSHTSSLQDILPNTTSSREVKQSIPSNKLLKTFTSKANYFDIPMKSDRKDCLIRKECDLVIKEHFTKSLTISKPDSIFTNKGPITPHISIPQSMFPTRYIRGELPCVLEHGTSGNYLSWICPVDSLDYNYFLPIFFDGLQCKDHPYSVIVKLAIDDMIYCTMDHIDKLIPTIRHLITPIRNALLHQDASLTLNVVKVLQYLIKDHPSICKALVPQLKFTITPMLPFMDKYKNIGDAMDYGQRHRNDIAQEVTYISLLSKIVCIIKVCVF